MVVQAPNERVCCDETTGKWRISSVVTDSAVGGPAYAIAVLQGVIDT